MKKDNDLIYRLVGFYFLILGISGLINFFISYGSISLWLSHITLFFVGIGILKKDSDLLAVQLNILIIPVFFWNIDLFYQLIIGKPLFGITNYLFDNFTGSFENFISLQHVYTVPITLAFVLFLGISKKDLWKWSLLEAYIVFLLSLIFSSAIGNYNCILRSCMSFIHFGAPFYQILWLVTIFFIVYVTNYLITKLTIK